MPFHSGPDWQGCECVSVDPGSHGLWIHVSEHQMHPCSGRNRYHPANPRGKGAAPSHPWHLLELSGCVVHVCVAAVCSPLLSI